MVMFSLVIVVLAVVSSSVITVDGLKCYQCSNVEGSSSITGKVIGNSACGDNFQPFSYNVKTVTCQFNQKCGFASGKATYSLPFFGDATLKIWDRDCVDSHMDNGCESTTNNKYFGLLNTILSALADVKIDAEICVCNTDLCDPKCKGSLISNVCLTWVIIGCVCGGVVLLIISGIACCYCCCCRRRVTSTTHVVYANAPAPVQAPIPGYPPGYNGSVGFTNPTMQSKPV